MPPDIEKKTDPRGLSQSPEAKEPEILSSPPKPEQTTKNESAQESPVVKDLKELFPKLSSKEVAGIEEALHTSRLIPAEDVERFQNAKTSEEAWEVLDELTSDIYAGADMQPDSSFETCFGIQEQIKLAQLRFLARTSPFAEELVPKMNMVYSMRRLVHNTMMLIEGGHGKIEEVAGMLQAESSLVDTLFGQEGVAEAYRLYEDLIERIRVRNHNWIPPEQMLRSWHQKGALLDKQVRELFIKAVKNGAIGGKIYKTEEEFKKAWPDWKINRALHLGRAYGSVSARFPEIVSQVRLPKGSAQMTSPYAEDFIRTFNPVEHLVRKFKIGREMAYLYYLLSGGEMRTFKDQKEMDEAFDKLTDISRVMSLSEKQRHKIPNLIWNLVGINSRAGGWRLKESIRDLPPEQRQYAGIEAALQGVEDTLKEEIPGFERLPSAQKKQLILQKKQEIWDLTLRRSPLVVWRALVIVRPDLQSKLNARVFGEEKVSEKQLNEVEDWLLILKEKAVTTFADELDYSLISDPSVRQQVKSYAEGIRELVWQEGFLGGRKEDLGKKKRRVEAKGLLDEGENGDFKKIFPFIITTSDMPFEKFVFEKGGQVGILGRRWRDINAASKTVGAFLGLVSELPRVKKREDYIEAIKQVFKPMDEYAGREETQNFSAYIAEMICRSDQKLLLDKILPAGMGNLFGLINRPRSYTQKIFGPESAALDAIDIRRLIEALAEEDLINSLGEPNHEEKLFKKLKVERKHVLLEYVLRWGPVGLGLFLFALLKEFKKEMEEELKKV